MHLFIEQRIGRQFFGGINQENRETTMGFFDFLNEFLFLEPVCFPAQPFDTIPVDRTAKILLAHPNPELQRRQGL